MIGFVIVSHSARLAEGVCELAAQMAQGRVRLAAAGGTDDPGQPIGTDAFRIRQAIEQVWDPDGVLVFTDLGSAVLSAEMALEMLDPDRRARVRLCEGPLVEGAVAAVSLAAAGAPMEEAAKWDQWGRSPTGPTKASGEPGTGGEEVLVTVSGQHGLHARPAAELVKLARRFQADVSIENITGGSAPVPAGGMQGLLAMGARQGHQLRIRASGPEAAEALAEIAAFLAVGENECTIRGTRLRARAGRRRTTRHSRLRGYRYRAAGKAASASRIRRGTAGGRPGRGGSASLRSARGGGARDARSLPMGARARRRKRGRYFRRAGAPARRPRAGGGRRSPHP